MLTKKTKNRSFIFFLFALFLIIAISISLKVLEDNVLYYLSPTEVKEKEYIDLKEKIRIGGMVKNKSLKKNVTIVNDKKVEKISFIITDLNKEILVSYIGILPDLFREGQGIIAEGKLHSQKSFIAEKVLAKHDENYMPPEIKEILKDK